MIINCYHLIVTQAILDASAGVEAQTVTVWKQSERYNLPKLVYVNKMDKSNADFKMCVEGIKKLECQPLLIQLPIFDPKTTKFMGVVDITTLEEFKWNNEPYDDGTEYTIMPVQNQFLYDQVMKERESLIEVLSDLDEKFGELVISYDSVTKVTSNEINNALRKAVILNKVIPCLCGSSYKNIAVQPLMDSIVKYFPSPIERPNLIVDYYQDNFCATVFKVIHNQRNEPITFIRLYSGQLSPLTKVYNIDKDVVEKVQKVYVPFADRFDEISLATLGNIVALSGLKHAATGDTLTVSQAIAEEVIVG